MKLHVMAIVDNRHDTWKEVECNWDARVKVRATERVLLRELFSVNQLAPSTNCHQRLNHYHYVTTNQHLPQTHDICARKQDAKRVIISNNRLFPLIIKQHQTSSKLQEKFAWIANQNNSLWKDITHMLICQQHQFDESKTTQIGQFHAITAQYNSTLINFNRRASSSGHLCWPLELCYTATADHKRED